MTTIGLLVNPQKLAENPEVARLAREAVAVLRERRVAVVVNDESAARLECPALGAPESELAARADMLVVFGGDGTILGAARQAAPRKIPILGVNLGGFGFLAEVNDAEVEDALHRLLAGDYDVDERMMLRADVVRGGRSVHEVLALNDIVVTKSGYARVLRLRTFVNDELLATHLADGQIVATPTGSTAYSLSAGGPIVHPAVDVMVLTPICAHTLNARPVVISAADTVTVRVDPVGAPPPPAMLTVDGQKGFPLETGDEVRAQRSPHRTRLIRMKREGFYTLLRTKLWWGER
jgi:NAD+ kinase